MEWVACNLAFAPAQWRVVRDRAASIGAKVVPWVRLCHVNQGEGWELLKERLALLVTTAQAWGCDTILPNYEDEAETFAPADVAGHLYDVLDWDGFTGWSVPGWIANDPDYTPIARRDPALLQIFPTDLRWEKWQVPSKLGDCVYHARVDKGFSHVGVTYETYRVDHTWFDCGAFMHSTFPGNTIAADKWGVWYP